MNGYAWVEWLWKLGARIEKSLSCGEAQLKLSFESFSIDLDAHAPLANVGGGAISAPTRSVHALALEGASVHALARGQLRMPGVFFVWWKKDVLLNVCLRGEVSRSTRNTFF